MLKKNDELRMPDRLDFQYLQRRLKIRQLVFFEAVCDAGSMLKAAEMLNITQPTLSKTIQELELLFGATLFERTNRGIQLTIYGVYLRGHTKRLLSHLRLMSDDLNALKLADTGHVVIGTLISASAKLLPKAVALLKQNAPGILITIKEGTNDVLMPALANGELDIVLGRIPTPQNYPGVNHTVLYNESICAVVGVNHPLVSAESLRLKDLISFPWILPVLQSPVRASVEQLFRSQGLTTPSNIVESLSILSNISMLMETQMIAMMPKAAAEHYERAGLLKVLPLSNSGEFGQVGYSLSDSFELTPAAIKFKGCLKQVVEELAESH